MGNMAGQMKQLLKFNRRLDQLDMTLENVPNLKDWEIEEIKKEVDKISVEMTNRISKRDKPILQLV